VPKLLVLIARAAVAGARDDVAIHTLELRQASRQAAEHRSGAFLKTAMKRALQQMKVTCDQRQRNLARSSHVSQRGLSHLPGLTKSTSAKYSSMLFCSGVPARWSFSKSQSTLDWEFHRVQQKAVMMEE